MLLTLAVVLAAPTPTAKLVAPSGEIGRHAAVTLTFTAPGVTWVDGCVPVEWERREGGTWVAVRREACAAQKPPTRVEGSLTLSQAPLAAGEYRAVVTWGAGCVPEHPLRLGACETLDVVRSEPFRVKGT